MKLVDRNAAWPKLVILGLLIIIFATPRSDNDPFDNPLTQDEQAVLKLKKDDPNAKRDNLDLIQRTAVFSDKLSIKNCDVRPIVLLLKQGQTLELSNLDQTDRTIETDRQHQFRVPSKSSIKITVDFGHGSGIYGIECDERDQLEGLFIVENK